MIIFGEENQGGFVWSLPRTLDGLRSDPTVWFQGYDEPLIAEQEPLSGFLLQFALFEAAMGADYLALPHEPTAQQVQRLTKKATLSPVPLRPFCPGTPPGFYVAPGLILHVSNPAGDDSFSVWVGATHRSALPRWPTQRSSGTNSTGDLTAPHRCPATGHGQRAVSAA